MNTTKLVDEKRVFDQLKCSSKKQALQSLAQLASEQVGLNEREVLQILLERERLGTTGMGHGVAIPHARLKEVKEPVGFLARLQKPVDFDSVDGEPVDLIFLLLAPICNGTEHLKALAKISRVLRDPVTRSYLRQAETRNDLSTALFGALKSSSSTKLKRASSG